MATDPAIGTTIRMRRQQLGMKQTELGRLVGVDRASVANWESGRHYPLRYLGKLESVLGISLTSPAADDDLDQAEADAERVLATIRRMRAERERRARSAEEPDEDDPGQGRARGA